MRNPRCPPFRPASHPVLNLCSGESVPNQQKWIALMVMAIALAVTHNASASAQCPNLSGKYAVQGEDGQVHLVIDQHECGRINILEKTNYLGTITTETHTLILDGKEQKDSGWMGGTEEYRTSAKFVGSSLQVKAKTLSGSTLTIIYSLTRARDLLEDAGTNGRVVAKRQK
jgi:hypothetical protein